MAEMRFTRDHEWIRLDGDIAVVGITDYAQQQLGDVVFVELPEVGRSLDQGDEAAVVESVKAASEVYAPMAGEVVEVNDALSDTPATVNAAPEADGWFFKLRLGAGASPGDLMDADAYKACVESLA